MPGAGPVLNFRPKSPGSVIGTNDPTRAAGWQAYVREMRAPDSAYMGASDAFSWYMERDPVLRSSTIIVIWLDRAPDRDILADRIDRISRLIWVGSAPAALAYPAMQRGCRPATSVTNRA